MEGILQIMQANPLAAAFGMLGLLCQLTWPAFRERRSILVLQFGIGASYSVQYALLEAWSGAGVASLGALQSAVALAADERPWLRRAGFLFLPMVGAICCATWSGPATFCAMASCMLIMAGRMQSDTLRLRCLLLAAAPFGMGYDLLVGAAPALVGAAASACLGAAALHAELHRRGVGLPQVAKISSSARRMTLGSGSTPVQYRTPITP